jgi:hypothetical protein
MAPVEKCFGEDKALRVVRSGAVWRIGANTVLRTAILSCDGEMLLRWVKSAKRSEDFGASGEFGCNKEAGTCKAVEACEENGAGRKDAGISEDVCGLKRLNAMKGERP